MKPDTIATACSCIVVFMIALCVVMGASGVKGFPPYGIAMFWGTVAAIIGARQPV